eukprot:12084317-Prorocentrum_lima.AAC.1
MRLAKAMPQGNKFKEIEKGPIGEKRCGMRHGCIQKHSCCEVRVGNKPNISLAILHWSELPRG